MSGGKPRSGSRQLFLSFCGLLIPVLVLLQSGCGSSGGTLGSAAAPAISSNPVGQTVRVGRSVTFSVVATGTALLTYQWSKNGGAIAGATGATYSTPAAAASDDGVMFTVKVTNAAGSASSTPAMLTVLPRAPADGDWRFQGIDLPFSQPVNLVTNLLPPWGDSYPNSIGSPLQTGVAPGMCVPGVIYDCAWLYAVAAAPTGVTGISTYYTDDDLSHLDADLNGLATQNIVITSVDVEPGNQIFAASYLQISGQSGFVLLQQSVDPSQIQAVASLLGSEGQVITALSFNADKILVLSYWWQSDTTTTYDVMVVSATASNFWTQAESLAQNGYIITAMGGNPTNGVLLVGTKVKGDTMSRPLPLAANAGTQLQLQNGTQSIVRMIYMPDQSYSFFEQ